MGYGKNESPVKQTEPIAAETGIRRNTIRTIGIEQEGMTSIQFGFLFINK